MSSGFCVRVQALEGYTDKVMSIGLAYDLVAAMKHKGDKEDPNPHFHIVVKTSIENQTFRKRMKTLFPEGKGNGHMSIKPWDGNYDAISYLFHEAPDDPLLVAVGLSDADVERARERNKNVMLIVEKAKDKASWKLEDEGYTHFKGKMDSDWNIGSWLMLQALRTGKYPPAPYHLKAMVTRIQFRLCEGDTRMEEQMVQSFMAQVYPIR